MARAPRKDPTASRGIARRVPLHVQVLEALHRDLQEGVWRPGDQLPTESELMARFGVSRITVRQALTHLVHEGVLTRRSGKGTFVARPRIEQELHVLTGFVEDMVALGMRASARVVSLEWVPAEPRVAQHLELPVGRTVLRLERVRLGNDEPLLFDVSYLPPALGERVAREDLAVHPIFSLLEEKYGIPVGFADYRIFPATASREVARHLEVPRGSPILEIERISYSENGTPLDYERLYYRGDRVTYRTRLLRRPEKRTEAGLGVGEEETRRVRPAAVS
jgi:GntR family transcriptional regulator